MRRKSKRRTTLWGGVTKMRNITFQLPKNKDIFGVFSGSATVPFIKTANKDYAEAVAKDLGQKWSVRRVGSGRKKRRRK